MPAPSLLVPPLEVVNVTCGQTVEIKLYNNTCANESEVSFNALLPRVAYAITCTAGGTLSGGGTIPHFTKGGPLGYVHTALQTLTYTAPATLPSCLTTPIDVVRAEARGFTRDLLIRVSCGGPVGQAATPTLSPTGGTFIDVGGTSVPVKVNAATSTPGATIRMTTDGSDPGPTSPARSSVDLPNNLTTTEQTIVKARAFADGLEPSGVAQQTYSIKASQPVLAPKGGTFQGPVTVSITSATPGAQIRYTINGSPPSPASLLYSAPFVVPCNTVVRAAVFKDRVVRSEEVQETYDCGLPTCVDFVAFFLSTFAVESDPGGHAPFVNLQSATLTTSVNGSNLSVSGNHPSTVSASGPFDPAFCKGTATGVGTVAGFNGITCRYELTLTFPYSSLLGTYTCGIGGGLPGNLPIRYGVTGTRQGP